MTTINLKDFYYWYLSDELVEVPDEVAEELMASKRREAAHAERVRYDPMLATMLSQPWSNNACRGYVIYAMENCGFSPNDIRRVVAELYEVFDIRSLEEAQQHFEESPY